MSTASSAAGGAPVSAPRATRSASTVRVGLIAFAAYHFAIAALMIFAPHTFFTAIGPFGVQNDHYLRDTATFNLAFGASLAIAYRRVSWRTPILCCVALQFALHAVNHLADIGAAHPHWLGTVRLRLALARDRRAGVAGTRVNPTAGGAAMMRIDGFPRHAGPFTRLLLWIGRRETTKLRAARRPRR